MYVMLFSDFDIGDAMNDFLGCDTLLNLDIPTTPPLRITFMAKYLRQEDLFCFRDPL
jgi:hypothetical protein